MIILDTNVVSELRKVNIGKADAKFTAWSKQLIVIQLYVSAITIIVMDNQVCAWIRWVERRMIEIAHCVHCTVALENVRTIYDVVIWMARK